MSFEEALRLRLSYSLSTRTLGKEASLNLLFRLLEGVRMCGSLAHATRHEQTSYRHAWGVIREWEDRLGRQLLVKARGRGATLTPFGARLLWAEQRLASRLTPVLETLEAEFAAALREEMTGARATLRAVASHDLLLPAFRELVNRDPGFFLDLRFAGSQDSLRALAEGQCELAGFHCPTVMGRGSSAHLSYRRWMKTKLHRVICFATRNQGLMVRPEHRESVRGLVHVRDLRLRFVNRQRGSGTRLLVDQLLSSARISPAEIRGYRIQEFTHIGVASSIAVGAADAGIGIEAAARQYGLAFVPLGREEYFFLATRETIETPGAQRLIQVLKSPELREAASGFAGYDAARAGEVLKLENALPWFSRASVKPERDQDRAPSRAFRAAQSSSL